MPIAGVPQGKPAAWRLSNRARSLLRSRTRQIETPEGRKATILQWAHARGRVSTTETADIVNITVAYAGTVLGGLEREGLLVAGRETRLGRGFYYTPASA